MARTISIFLTLAVAGLFAWMVPLERLYNAFQPMTTALSIMVAAVFVRLNRGMPSLEWKSLDHEKRTVLTTAIVDVSTEYGWIIGINAAVLAMLVTLQVIGVADAELWPDWVRRVVSAAVGGLASLCSVRMAYVVWRDIDIVRLQKRLIDDSATRDAHGHQIANADEKIASIRVAGIRSIEVKPPKSWGD